MKDNILLAKKLLESKGYNVKKIKESVEGLQKYTVVVAIGNSDGDGETGMTGPATYNEIVSARSEEDAERQVARDLPAGDGVLSAHLATEKEIKEYEIEEYYRNRDKDFIAAMNDKYNESKKVNSRRFRRVKESKRIHEATEVGDKVTIDGREGVIKYIDDEDNTALVKFTDGGTPKSAIYDLADISAPAEEEAPEETSDTLGGKYADVLAKIANIEDSLDALNTAFELLVPEEGPADSKAGEIVRAMMRILYRYHNDGDKFYEGYGIETCGASAAFLSEEVPPIGDMLVEIAENNLMTDLDKNYEEGLKKLSDTVVDYLIDNPDLFDEPNTQDSLDTDDSFIKELEPKYELEAELPPNVIYHLEQGHISMRDLEWDLEGWDYIRNHPLTVQRYYIFVEDLGREEYEELEYNIYRWLEEFGEDLDNEYGSEEDSYEDEEEYEDEE